MGAWPALKRAAPESDFFIRFQEGLPGNSGLCADCPQGRSLDRLVIRDRHRGLCAVRVDAFERNMVTRPDNIKPKRIECLDDPLLWDILREFHFR